MIFQNVSKTYGDKEVLKIENLELESGKIYAIVGSNGCGKSTFLKVISKQIKSDKKATIDFGGGKVCYMPQKNYAFKMTTLKNVLIATSSSSKEDAMALLKRLKIDNLAKQKASKLSGGETARMALCRTILSDADVLLLDEPTAAMDIESTKLSEELIKEYNEQKGATIIIVTHSINQARRIADFVIFMKDGMIVETGEKAAVLDTPKEKDTKEFLEFFSAEV